MSSYVAVRLPNNTEARLVYYDRILVMDAGKVAEFDTPLNLYDKVDSIFRSLCDEAGLSRQDIVKIRASVHTTQPEA